MTGQRKTAGENSCGFYFLILFTFYFLLASEQIPALIASLIHVPVFSPYSSWDFLFRSRSGFYFSPGGRSKVLLYIAHGSHTIFEIEHLRVAIIYGIHLLQSWINIINMVDLSSLSFNHTTIPLRKFKLSWSFHRPQPLYIYPMSVQHTPTLFVLHFPEIGLEIA